MQTPLLFAVFSKDARRLLVGFALYREAADVQGMARPYREALQSASGSAWRTVCSIALQRLGGSGSLKQIYAELEGNRPSKTQFWREKVRQTLRVYADAFTALDVGHYALRNGA